MEYKITGFQSACAEYHEDILSLDERYRIGAPSVFIIEASGSSHTLGLKTKDKLIIDRSLKPMKGELVLLVLGGEFKLTHFLPELLKNRDPDSGDFIWGVVTTILRELR
jgi:SOS-response transcriptional repressor LexA